MSYFGKIIPFFEVLIFMNTAVAPTISSETASISARWQAYSSRLFTVTWVSIVTVLLGLGWWFRDEGYLSAASGAGYWLGIVGIGLMLLLLTYSLRKRWRVLRRTFPVKWWFQIHMTFGIVGPVCILFHSNFHLGSLNSTVALICMLLVAGSGIVGRYIYNRIHFGLYGERIRLRQAVEDFKSLHSELATLAVTEKQQSFGIKLFAEIEKLVERQQDAGWLSLWRERGRVKKISIALQQYIDALDRYHSKRSNSPLALADIHNRIQQDYAALLAMLQRLPGLRMFEGLFSLWHVIHIPIFVLMVATATVHVVVVHMY